MIIVPDLHFHTEQRLSDGIGLILPVGAMAAYGAHFGEAVALTKLGGRTACFEKLIELIQPCLGSIVAAAERHTEVF